jgi:hypothetical protein
MRSISASQTTLQPLWATGSNTSPWLAIGCPEALMNGSLQLMALIALTGLAWSRPS